MERGFVALFERNVLFRIARFVAFSICFLLFLSLLAGAVYLVSSGQDQVNRPDAVEIAQSLKPVDPVASNEETYGAEVAPQLHSSALSGMKVPPVLQEMLLSQENQQTFKNWMDEMPEDERQAFVDGVAQAVVEGRKAGLADEDVVNAFHDSYAEYVAQKQAAEAAATTQRLYVAGSLLSILVLLALFSLVLVLLAIERNTRVVSQASAA